ncbi:unnamed protein product [Ixodes persulcatus]
MKSNVPTEDAKLPTKQLVCQDVPLLDRPIFCGGWIFGGIHAKAMALDSTQSCETTIHYNFLSPNSTCCYHIHVNVARAGPDPGTVPRRQGPQWPASLPHAFSPMPFQD